MRLLLITCLTILVTFTPARAGGGPGIFAESDNLFGAHFGMAEEEALAILKKSLFEPDQDSGRIVGCPFDGIDTRWVSWGGLTAEFDEAEDGTLKFARWVYQLDRETGRPIPGGPQRRQIIMPDDIRAGDRFSDAARAWGFTPEIDEVFEVAMHFAERFAIMTNKPDIDAPIAFVGAPSISVCE